MTCTNPVQSLPPGAGPGGAAGPLRNGNPRGNPNLAPRCGARTRSGNPCRAPAMANGRCRMHGGRCTGPRTPEGMARMTAAHTTHGKYAMVGAPQRAEQRYIRTLIVRSRLTCAAKRLQAHLPPGMAARLALDPPELKAPMHPSQVAFALRQAAMPGGACQRAREPVVRTGPRGVRRRADAGRGARDAGVALRGRETERLAARAEAAAQAPWKAAIAFARAAKRAARGASPGGGSGTTRGVRSNVIQRENALRAGDGRADPPSPVALRAPTSPAARERCGLRDAGTGPGVVTGRPGPEAALRADSPRDQRPEACLLQRELAARAAGLRARGNRQDQAEAEAGPGPDSALRGNNAIQRETGAARRLMRLSATKALAPRSTTLACTWVPRPKATRAGRFGRAAPPGSHGPQAAPVGVAAVLRAGGVQQFHATPATGRWSRW